jgi:hypothetical protein
MHNAERKSDSGASRAGRAQVSALGHGTIGTAGAPAFRPLRQPERGPAVLVRLSHSERRGRA